MTTYHFKRGSKNFVAQKDTFSGYLTFLSITFLFFIFHIINVPRFFGGEFHLFLFDLGLFYLILVRGERLHFFTIFCFYLMLDFLEGSIAGLSFPIFLLSLLIAKMLLNILPSIAGFLLSSIGFLVVLNVMKILGFYIFAIDINSPYLLKFLAKSILYSVLFFANFLLVSQR